MMLPFARNDFNPWLVGRTKFNQIFENNEHSLLRLHKLDNYSISTAAIAWIRFSRAEIKPEDIVVRELLITKILAQIVIQKTYPINKSSFYFLFDAKYWRLY